MRALRSCDFCDADAAGTFEIVPPELEPTEAEQRRVVLCADCKPRLERLLEPLLARAGADTESAADPGSGTVVAAANESTEKRNRTTSPNAIVSESDAASGAGERSPATEPDAGPLLEDGITFDDEDGKSATETESDARVESTPETDASTATDPDDDLESETATSDDETAADDEPSATAASTDEESTDEPADERSDAAARPPNAYAKVVRLLRNREFPMQRSAVEELAAGAYDLEDHEAEAIIDHALEQDEFVERGGELRRP